MDARLAAPRSPGGSSRSWLADKINNSRRAARPKPCPKCGTATLVGPDHDTVAITVRLDAHPVTPLDEAIALLAGHATYSCDLVRGNLHHREPHHLEAIDQPHPIHLEHRCPPTTPEVLF